MSAPFKDHFSGHARAYAAFRPTWPTELVDALADASPQLDHAWDVGCGSGQLSTLLAERFAAVTATDASAEQVRHATPHERVAYRVAPAEASALPEASVDCVVAAQAAHWFDMPAFAREVRRVARPGALVTLASYGLLFIRDDLDALINRFSEETVGPYWPPERRHVDTGYRDLFFPFTQVTLPAIDMRARWSVQHVLGYIFTWSSVAAARRAGATAALDAFAGELTRAWGHDEPLDVRWPLILRAGRV